MAIIERDSFGGQASTYTLNIRELLLGATRDKSGVPDDITLALIEKELAQTGKITLTRDELQRIKDILAAVDL